MMANEINKTQDVYLAGCLKALAGMLGLLQREPRAFLQGGEGLSADEVESLIEQRKIARESKNWAESDRIRDLLTANKIVLRDSAEGTTWTRG